jgi:hypothetical protein
MKKMYYLGGFVDCQSTFEAAASIEAARIG